MEGKQMQIFVKGVEGKTYTITISKDAVVDDLKLELYNRLGIKVEEQILVYTTKQLQDGKSLSHDYEMEHGSTVFMVMRLLGGTSEFVKELDDGVELSEDPDMITWDDDPENKRAKMPCGHAITPESLTVYCRSLLDAGKYRLLCPYLSPDKPPVHCRKEWDYIIVRRLAVLSDDEKKEFESKISNNYLLKSLGVQECPRCLSLVKRSKNDVRVICPLCTLRRGTNFEFCWQCLHEWKTSDLKNCGNSECSGEDPRLKILRDCPRKTIVGVKNCPSRRACIKCGLLIEHERACKHMTCRCKAQFCFICLSPKGENGFPCGRYNETCKIAPVQTTIVGE